MIECIPCLVLFFSFYRLSGSYFRTAQDISWRSVLLCLITPTPPQKNRYQRHNKINQRRPMSPPAPEHCLQADTTMPKYFCYASGHRQCVFVYRFPQYQRSYTQLNSFPQSHHQSYSYIRHYRGLCNCPIYIPTPLQYTLGFGRNFQVNVGQVNRTLVASTRSIHPPGGIVKEGQFFFSNKVYVQLSIEQQIRLGAVNPGTQNKCRKIRPWLVLWKLNNGRVIVV